MDIWILLAVLAAAAGVAYRRRLRDAGAAGPALGVDDAMIRRIEDEGRIEIDEPNDLDRIREEEARFWEETTWEDPEEY